MSVVAWGDESVRIAAPTPSYLLCACILDNSADCAALEPLLPKGASKLHWRELTDSVKAKSLKAVAGMGQQSVLVAASPLPKRKQERARRKCLGALLPRLEAMGVDRLLLETRQPFKDKKDVEMLLALRRAGAISGIDLEHRGAAGEPRLWLPDLVVGMYGDDMCGELERTRWRASWDTIRSRITVLGVGL